MKSYVLLLGLLQTLGCSGDPLNAELEAIANRGLGAALTRVNSAYDTSNLFRVTRGSVTRVIPVGLKAVDLFMIFDIKETVCLKESRKDPQTCAFRPGFFVPSSSCSSRVRMTVTSAQVISLRCGHDGSSSSESSEEVSSRGRDRFDFRFANKAPAPSAPPPPTQPERGDTFNNYLV
ncbi:Secreted phosphoprotein 24 [Collichthys lucidus]|uniref:Secreted phosphoprotein 24 n=1 Tax=Collichthys lucidus TaxID=240159 RepID=A0A4U5TXE8_COLLU|nr:Secreted phosphoprotein 24 [Collichthys lucidus]